MKKASCFSTNIILISTGIIFILLTLTMFISNAVILILSKQNLIAGPPDASLFPFLLQTGFISILTGTGLTLCTSHLFLRPFNILIQAIHSVSNGNFQTKIHLEHPQKFKELSHCFNQMTEELSGIEILRSDFINNFSHEFKTPIVSIQGFANLLKKGNITKEEQSEYLEIIIEETNRLTELSTNVLNLSKIESISLLTDFTTFNVSEQIRETVILLENKWDKKEISFRLNLEELQIRGNEQLMKQVWMNLIDNAIKFSSAQSEIILTLSSNDEFIKVIIKDHGIGMAPDTQHCIFDKFYQGETSHSSTGNGLGLPIVKRILELHTGTISVESRLGAGSTFIVTLPVSSSASYDASSN